MQTLSTHWLLVSVLNAVAIRQNTHCTYNVNSEPPCLIATRTIDIKTKISSKCTSTSKIKTTLRQEVSRRCKQLYSSSTEPCVSNLGFHMSVLVC